jgi:hypothetical protein
MRRWGGMRADRAAVPRACAHSHGMPEPGRRAQRCAPAHACSSRCCARPSTSRQLPTDLVVQLLGAQVNLQGGGGGTLRGPCMRLDGPTVIRPPPPRPTPRKRPHSPPASRCRRCAPPAGPADPRSRPGRPPSSSLPPVAAAAGPSVLQLPLRPAAGLLLRHRRRPPPQPSLALRHTWAASIIWMSCERGGVAGA